MAVIGFFEIFLAIISFFLISLLNNNYFHNKRLTNWPFVGMLPALLHNLQHLHDYITEVSKESKMTFIFKGPWFSNLNFIITTDPANVRYIMITNFSNYQKGAKFKEILDILGDGFSNSDFELWKVQRKFLQGLMNHGGFQNLVIKTTKSKIEKGLVSILELACEQDLVIELQDLFRRYTFDSLCIMVMGFDPNFLSTEFPKNEFAEAIDKAEEATFYRHIKPEHVWKLQRWLCVGQEKKMKEAHETIDRVIANYISMKRSNMSLGGGAKDEDLLASYMSIQDDDETGIIIKPSDDKFLRDTVLNTIIAGRSGTSLTLSWFFWLLSSNPKVLDSIREEIQSKVQRTDGWILFDLEEVNGLVYLHGGLCETLRLYPPVPIQFKTSVKQDVLPSGHRIRENTQICFIYILWGRSRTIWGDDCLEFKPERWITVEGRMKHEPSYKFFGFNAGPRTCLGKDMAFTQMKLAAAAMIHNYNFKAVKGQIVVPNISTMLPIMLHLISNFNCVL